MILPVNYYSIVFFCFFYVFTYRLDKIDFILKLGVNRVIPFDSNVKSLNKRVENRSTALNLVYNCEQTINFTH